MTLLCDKPENIPFQMDMQQAIYAGEKTATSRLINYGEGNREFFFNGYIVTYNVYAVRILHLKEIAEKHFKEEGFNSPSEFIAKWVHIHYVVGWTPNRKVFFHMFKIIKMEKLEW